MQTTIAATPLVAIHREFDVAHAFGLCFGVALLVAGIGATAVLLLDGTAALNPADPVHVQLPRSIDQVPPYEGIPLAAFTYQLPIKRSPLLQSPNARAPAGHVSGSSLRIGAGRPVRSADVNNAGATFTTAKAPLEALPERPRSIDAKRSDAPPTTGSPSGASVCSNVAVLRGQCSAEGAITGQ